MSGPKHYVSHQGQQLGPYSPDEIVGLVGQGKLSILDYVYDDSREDWVLFMDYPLISERIKSTKPKAPPKSKGGAETDVHPKLEAIKAAELKPKVSSGETEWFVLKGENKYGPFAYIELIKMLQECVVFEFDFAWHEGLETWKRIAELSDFSKEKVRALRDSSEHEVNQIFFRRRHKRVKYDGTILIHDNKKVWKGQAVEISEGGAGIVMDNSIVVPGQQLFLHFKPGNDVPPFNAVCEVVSKQYVFGVKDSSAPVKYGLKFKDLSNDTQKALKEFSKSKEAA
jgi:hypothetical protein